MRWRAVAFSIALLTPAAAVPASWERCVEEARRIAEPWAARDGFHCTADGQIQWVPYHCESPPPRSVEVRCLLPSPTGGRYSFHSIRWSPSGQRTSELRMEAGAIVRSRSWHANGQLLSDPPYEAGTMHGVYRSWHANGRLMSVGEFVHGKRRGEWLAYDETGAVRFRERYDERGEPH